MSNTLTVKASMEEIVTLDDKTKKIAAKLQEARDEGSDWLVAMYTARGIAELQKCITDNIMHDFMSLQGSVLGFRTDKDGSGGYKIDQVKDVLIKSLMLGLRPTGNEWNIIAGNLYVTKEGFRRLLKELPGFSNLQVQFGVPHTSENGALVPADASWRYQGKDYSMSCHGDFRIPIRINKGMGADAILGKAESKLLRRIYQQCTGSAVDADPEEPLEATPAIEQAEAS